MNKHYTLENKPNFTYGQTVAVDMKVMGSDGGILIGKIVGKGSEHIVDMWLVEFENDFGPTYPYKVASIIHTAFVEVMAIKDLIKALKK